jgi:hypothetical protein
MQSVCAFSNSVVYNTYKPWQYKQSLCKWGQTVSELQHHLMVMIFNFLTVYEWVKQIEYSSWLNSIINYWSNHSIRQVIYLGRA